MPEHSLATKASDVVWYLIRSGLTPQQIARHCRVTPSAVSQWRNEYTEPRWQQSLRLLDMYKAVRKEP